MDIKDINNKKTPIVRIDSSLGRLKDKVWFPDKLAEANKTLAIVGLPKATKKDKKS